MQFEGKLIGPMNCVFMTSTFEWRDVKLLKDVPDESTMARFFDEPANRFSFFNPAHGDLEDSVDSIPCLPSYRPVELAAKVIATPTTP